MKRDRSSVRKAVLYAEKNPTKWGQNTVRIQSENLNLVLSEDETDAIRNDRGPFKIRSSDTTRPAEIVQKKDGLLEVKLLTEDEISQNEDRGYSIKKNRERRITSLGRYTARNRFSNRSKTG